MRVKIFDESHEKDLEMSVNQFLSTLNSAIIDVKFEVALSAYGEEQLYCFSAMVLYEEE